MIVIELTRVVAEYLAMVDLSGIEVTLTIGQIVDILVRMDRIERVSEIGASLAVIDQKLDGFRDVACDEIHVILGFYIISAVEEILHHFHLIGESSRIIVSR